MLAIDTTVRSVANEYIEKKLYPLLFSPGTKLGQYTLESDPNLIPFFLCVIIIHLLNI